MSANNYDTPGSAEGGNEPAGAERCLHPGENIRICSSDIQIKKFRFDSYLTNRRLFFIDQNDRKPGVTAKEIPAESIISSYLEESPAREPLLVLSVKTSDDEIRTMKMTFVHTGEDRAREAEEWVHLLSQTASAPILARSSLVERSAPPGARSLTDTIVIPSPGTKQTATGIARPKPAGTPVEERAVVPEKARSILQSGSTVVYCYHCGKRLPGNANFCPFCGTRIHDAIHDEESHLHLPLHQYRESPETRSSETTEKKGWRRFFGR